MTQDVYAFERECDAARDRWEKLPGDEIAEVIDNVGDWEETHTAMLHLARKNFTSDAYEILTSLFGLARAETAQEVRDYITANNPILLDVFDRYAKLAAEEIKIHEAWIEGEADAVLNFPDDGSDRAYDEARDNGRI